MMLILGWAGKIPTSQGNYPTIFGTSIFGTSINRLLGGFESVSTDLSIQPEIDFLVRSASVLDLIDRSR